MSLPLKKNITPFFPLFSLSSRRLREDTDDQSPCRIHGRPVMLPRCAVDVDMISNNQPPLQKGMRHPSPQEISKVKCHPQENKQMQCGHAMQMW